VANIKLVRKSHGVQTETDNDKGERIWIEPKNVMRVHGYKVGYRGTNTNASMGGEKNRGFTWRDPEKGISKPVTSFPDKLIRGLHCPDCGEPACETDQVGVALCTGTPGWFFYYRQRTDGYGKPKTVHKIVGGELKEVTEHELVTIERTPLGEFVEVNEDDDEEKV